MKIKSTNFIANFQEIWESIYETLIFSVKIVEILEKPFINIAEFWTTTAKNQRKFEIKIAKCENV